MHDYSIHFTFCLTSRFMLFLALAVISFHQSFFRWTDTQFGLLHVDVISQIISLRARQQCIPVKNYCQNTTFNHSQMHVGAMETESDGAELNGFFLHHFIFQVDMRCHNVQCLDTQFVWFAQQSGHRYAILGNVFLLHLLEFAIWTHFFFAWIGAEVRIRPF